MTKVLGMGNALVDVLATIEDDKLLEMLELPKGSMQLIDNEKFKVISKEINKFKTDIVSGGSASNTIAGLARLGVETGFIGRVGNDSFAEYFKKDIAKYNITSHLVEVNEASGVASTFISADGERTFGTYLGAAALLKAEDLREEVFASYEYFYIEGYLVQNYSLIRTAIALAKNAGAKTVLDMASYNVVEENRDFLLKLISGGYVDIVFANEQEAGALLNLPPEDAVSELAKIVDIAIVKTGANGSWLQRGEEKVFVPALSVNCIDSTGAGDLYASGFLYGLINNYTLQKSGETGTKLAAAVIQEIGPKISDKKWDEILKDLQ